MLETRTSEILENILSLLALEGSFEVEEKQDFINVIIDTQDAGKLIGKSGDTLSSLQLIVNQILSMQLLKEGSQDSFKKIIIDVSGWKRNKEQQLLDNTKKWAQQVKETKQPLELEPMPAWQRRIVHLTIEGIEDVESTSLGEGQERHLVIKPTS